MNRRLCGHGRYDYRYYEISSAGLYRIGAAGYFCKAKQKVRFPAYPAEKKIEAVENLFLTTGVQILFYSRLIFCTAEIAKHSQHEKGIVMNRL